MNTPRRLIFVLLALCCVCSQELEFWTSLPLSSSDGGRSKQFTTGAQLAFRVAKPQKGVLETHNVSLNVLDDGGNNTLFEANIQSILQKPTLLGLVFSSSTNNARYIQAALNNSVPFISPISSHSSLRTNTSRNIINLRPSNQAEAYGMLSALRNKYSIQRLAFFYETGDEDGEEALDQLRYYISVLGLSLSSFANSTLDEGELSEAVTQIQVGNPAAILIWSKSQALIMGFFKQM
eukprot:TRINITY_DN26508_c0_g1_i1.p1 TRINITY_DN26508_c0_g1~~TRINITY_DN26508_c0_g1_i1.p1  ORF type:complete len:236 (+),score=24.96 TRINITY_DN26508_c0_g1_i1:215-922(+)